MNYYRKKGSADIMDETGKVLATPEEQQAALATVGGRLDLLPIKEPIAPTVRRYTGGDEISTLMEGLPKALPTAAEEAKTRADYLAGIQPQISLIEQAAAQELAGAEATGISQAGRARSIAGRAGLIGSPRGEAMVGEVEAATKEEKALINQAKNLKIEALMNQTDDRASQAISLKKQEVMGNINAYLNYKAGIKTEAREDTKAMAQAGFSLDQLKLSTDANGKNYKDILQDQTGWDSFVFDSVYNLSLPKAAQEEKIFSEVSKDGKLTVMWQNPKTGAVRTEKYDWDKPEVEAGWSVDVAPNGTMYKWSKEGKVEIIGEGYAKPKDETQKTDWDNAKKFITDNPDASYQDLVNGIKQYTKLGDSDITGLLKDAGKKPGGTFLNENWIKSTYTKDAMISNYAKEHKDTNGNWDQKTIQAAKDAGLGKWNQSIQTEAQNYVNSDVFYTEQLAILISAIKSYQNAGYSDEDIMKMMK